MHHSRFHDRAAGWCVLILACAAGACTDKPVFEPETAAAQATLALPRMSPPVEVSEVSGAPADWNLRDRLVEALRAQDIPADSAVPYRSAYSLRGTFLAAPERGGVVEFQVIWQLRDPARKPVGETTHRAAIPTALLRESRDEIAKGLARASAERIAAMLPTNAALPLEGARPIPPRPSRAEPAVPRPGGMIGRVAPNL